MTKVFFIFFVCFGLVSPFDLSIQGVGDTMLPTANDKLISGFSARRRPGVCISHAKRSGLQISVKVPPSMANMRSLKLAAVTMFLTVVLGAFGAHGLEERLQATDHVDTWKTAVLYQAIHGLALMGVGIWELVDRRTFDGPWLKAAGPFWLAGVVAFSGSLYAYSLGGPHGLVFVTPIGGLLFLAGWAMLAVGIWRLDRRS